jgi:hypothetical protein
LKKKKKKVDIGYKRIYTCSRKSLRVQIMADQPCLPIQVGVGCDSINCGIVRKNPIRG